MDFIAYYTTSPDFNSTSKHNTRGAPPVMMPEAELQHNSLKQRGTERTYWISHAGSNSRLLNTRCFPMSPVNVHSLFYCSPVAKKKSIAAALILCLQGQISSEKAQTVFTQRSISRILTRYVLTEHFTGILKPALR